MISAEEIKTLMALNKRRTPGEWKPMSSNRSGEFTVYVGEYGEPSFARVCGYAHRGDRDFIAASHKMPEAILTLQTLLNQTAEALELTKDVMPKALALPKSETATGNAVFAVDKALAAIQPYLSKEGE